MKIAHFSDLHLTDDARRPWRLGDQAATLAALVDDVLTTEPDLVLLGGDLYGHEVPHRSTPRERAVLFPQLVRLAAVAPVVVVQGNHDLADEIEALAHLGADGAWPIRVVTGAAVLSVPTRAGTAHVYALAYPTKRGLLSGEEAPAGGAVGAQAAVEDALRGLLGAWGHRVRRRRVSHPTEVHVGLMHVQVAGSQTSGGEVLDGQEVQIHRSALDDLGLDYVALGHLHRRQEVARRAWYCGSPWRNDHSEREPKGWHSVNVAIDRYGVEHRLTSCRAFATLDYTWGPPADREAADAGWLTRPTEAAILYCAGAEVRMRLTVSEAHVAGCPWSAEVERVTAIANRVVEERTITPVHRVRAPEVAAAITDADKAIAYWSSLADPPIESDRASAIDAITILDRLDDEAIAIELRAMVS